MASTDNFFSDSPKTQPDLEVRLASIGQTLGDRIRDVVASIPGSPQGPVHIARKLGIDKVLASRVLRASRNRDPMAMLYFSPGPEPLRRLLKCARKEAIPAELIASAEDAVRQFEMLIQSEAGDRTGLDAILSAWLPEARAEFELRKKQSLFRSTSLLRGAANDLHFSTAIVNVAENGEHLDIVWVIGFYGLRRVRPGANVKFTTKRVRKEETPRRPLTLNGDAVEGLDGLLLPQFCSQPLAELQVRPMGEFVHYVLGDAGFGPRSAVDIVLVEVNRQELKRYLPADSTRRRRQFVSEVTPPCKLLVFDVLLHRDVFPNTNPSLFIYDTVFEGTPHVDDPSRDIDRLDLCESIQSLGNGLGTFRTVDVPEHAALLTHIFEKLNWPANEFRGYRSRIEYPIYGTSVTMAFDATEKKTPPARKTP